MTKYKCYVGEWEARPVGIFVENFCSYHPRDFQRCVDELKWDIYTNNPMIANCFPAENVIVCKYLGGEQVIHRRITEYENYHRWKNQFAPGDFWSLVGESWL